MTKNGVKNMKVDAVRNLNVVHNYNFGTKEKVEKGSVTDISRNSSMMTKVPLIVLLAMNPATLNSAIPMSSEFDNSERIVMISPEHKPYAVSSYVINPLNIEQSRPRNNFGWSYLKYGKIQYNAKVKVDNNREMDLVYFTPTGLRKIENEVSEIYIIDPQKKGCTKSVPHPPRIQKIIYHDIGKDKEYCSVITKGHVTNDSGIAIGNEYREIKIDDDTANKILAFTLGKTEWENNTDIEFETTTREEVNQPRVEYFK